jgi:hypothetical protein
MPLNLGLEGKEYPPIKLAVTAARVELFREAIGQRADGVPPTFAAVGEFASLPRITDDPDLGMDYSRVVHGEQRYEWRRALRVGEELTVHSRIASIRVKGGHGFLTVESELRDTAGETVVVGRSTMIERGM